MYPGTAQTAAALRNLSAIKKRRQEPDDAALLAVDTVSNVQAASQAAGKTATEKAAKGPQPETVIRIGADGQRTVEYSGPVDDPRKAIATATNDPWAQYGAMVLGNEEANQAPGAAPEAAPDPFDTQLARSKNEAAKLLAGIPGIDELPDDPKQLAAMAGVAEPKYIWGLPRGTYAKAKHEYEQVLADPMLKHKVAALNLKKMTDILEGGSKAQDQLGDSAKQRSDATKAAQEQAKYKDQAWQEEAETVDSWFKNSDITRFASYDDWKKSFEGAYGKFTPTKNTIAEQRYFAAKKAAADKAEEKLFKVEDQQFQRENADRADRREIRLSTPAPKLKKASSSNTYFATVAPETLIARVNDPEWDSDAAMESVDRAESYWEELGAKNDDKYRENAAKIRSLKESKVNAARGLNFNLRNETEAELVRLEEEQKSLQRKNKDLVRKVRVLRASIRGDQPATPAAPAPPRGSLQRGVKRVITNEADALRILQGGR